MNISDINIQVFEKLREDLENNHCFDCEMPDPTHASIDYGTFLCPQCAKTHLNLFPNSQIKLLTSLD